MNVQWKNQSLIQPEPITTAFTKDFIGIVISALIFVVSFLWKDLLSDIERIFFPINQGIWGRLMYIMIVTLLLLILVIFLKRSLDLDQTSLNHFSFDDSPLDSPNDSPNHFDPGQQA